MTRGLGIPPWIGSFKKRDSIAAGALSRSVVNLDVNLNAMLVKLYWMGGSMRTHSSMTYSGMLELMRVELHYVLILDVV